MSRYNTYIIFNLRFYITVILLAYNFLCNHVKPNGIPLCYDISYMFHMYEGWNFNSGNYLFTTDTK